MSNYLGAIVIPTFNEAATIQATLKALQHFRERWQILIADGGSQDNTLTLAKSLCDRVVNADKGRAAQMNAGALAAKKLIAESGIIVFLHADTQLPNNFEKVMAGFAASGKSWGRFDVKLSGEQSSLRLIESFMNGRSRITGIATGDQVMFFRMGVFWELNGFPKIPLMEDVEMSRRAKHKSPPFCPTDQVVTSSRKWEQEGIWKTVVLMWFCRAAYFFGVSASQIHRWYYR